MDASCSPPSPPTLIRLPPREHGGTRADAPAADATGAVDRVASRCTKGAAALVILACLDGHTSSARAPLTARAPRTYSAATSPSPCWPACLGTRSSGWWWLDPIAALAIAGLTIREGLQSWHG